MADSVRIDLTGAGRLITSASGQTANPGDFAVFRDLWVDRALRIRKRPGTGVFRSTSLGSEICGMHEYTRVDPSTGAVTRYLLRATVDASTTTALERFTAGAWVSITLPITPTVGGKWVFVNFDNRCFFSNGKDAMLVYDGTSVRLVGEDGPPVALSYTIASQYTTGTVAVTKGSKTVTGTGTVWDLSWLGSIEIDGNVYTIQQVTAGTTLLLTEEYKQETLSGLVYSLDYGPQSWNLPPKYAYAYYNPTTGHCTNIRAASISASNILEITERDQLNVQVKVLMTTDYDAYANGYTQIKLFRTPREGTILVALDTTLANTSNNPVITVLFSETVTTAPDTYLTRFEAPITSNRVPVSGISALATYQGRMWGLKHNRAYYSLSNTEVGFGVAEECWPERHSLIVNQATALTLVGGEGADESLIIQTRDGDLSIDGWDVRNYRAYPLPTRRSGSFLHSATGKDGSFVCFYADKRIIQYPQGLDIGAPIQDSLDLIPDSLLTYVRMTRYTGQHWDILMVSAPRDGSSAENDVTFVYDYDAARWYDWNVGFEACVQAHDPTPTDEIQFWMSYKKGLDHKSYTWLRKTPVWYDYDSQETDFAPLLKTHPLRPFEEHDAILRAIHLWVNDATYAWSGDIYLNEESSAAVSCSFVVAPHQRQNANGKLLEWVPSSSERFRANTFTFGMTFPSLSPPAPDASELYVERIALFFDRYQDDPSRGSAR